MTDLLAAALEYAAAGVAVFPARVSIVDGHKRVQPIASWRKASTTDRATITGWFAPGRPWADASLCIDCGKSELVVVDLDQGDGKEGIDAWGELIAEHGLPVTHARARTPGGGEHWYYREHPRRIVSIDSTGKVAPGVDIRGLGGFVLAWPSTDARGAYGQVDLEQLANAPVIPDLVVERMNARPAAAEPPTTHGPAPARQHTDRDEFWDQFTERELTFAQAKEHCLPPLQAFRALRTPEDNAFNDKLNALACIWSHFIPEFMTEAQAEAEIYEAAVANGSVKWQGEHAVRATIRSGLRQTSDRWKAARVDEPAGGETSELDREVARLHLRADARDRFQAERHARSWAEPDSHGSLAAELQMPDEDTPWRLKGLLGVGHNAVLIAGRKVGKTTIVNNLIRSYVDGGAFLERFDVTPTEAGVAVFNYEVDERQYRRWIREVGIANASRVHMLHLRGRSMPLRDPQVRAWTVRWLKDRRIGLWIVDPYSRAYVGSLEDGNDEAQVGAFLDTLDVIKAQAGVSELVMPVHTPKARVDAGEETAIGSQRLEGWPDSMWYLTRDFESGLRFLRAEGRDVDVPEEQLTYDDTTRRLVLGGWDRKSLRAKNDVDAVVEYIRNHPGCSQNDIKNALPYGLDRIKSAVRSAGTRLRIEHGKNREQKHYAN